MRRIDGLVEDVVAAVESKANLVRGKVTPTAVFTVEEPIAWTKIYGFDANRYFTDPLFYFEQTHRQKLWRWTNFPDDEEPLTMDIPASLGWCSEYTFIGLNLSFDHSGVPNLQSDHPLSKDPDLRQLKPVNFNTSGWMPRILQWYDDLRKIAAGRGVNVILTSTWVRGGLDLAIQLRGYENFVLDTLERPQFVHDLMKWLVEERCRWWEAYYRHFGQEISPTGIADDWINVPFITPGIFADFVLPGYKELERFHV